MPVYASSLDLNYPESYIANDLWRIFSFLELKKVMRQRESNHLKDTLNKVCVGNIDSEVEGIFKSRIICSNDLNYPKYGLHVFAKNVLMFNHKKFMLNQLNGMLMTIDAINSVAIGCGLSDSQIMADRNRSISQTFLNRIYQKLYH